MEKALAVALLLLFTFLTKHRSANGQVFCRSQISLANQACSLRNLPGVRAPVPRQLNESSSSTTTAVAHGSGYEVWSSDDDDDEEEEDEGRRRRRHRHNAERNPYDTACCRRLMALDNSCVCQAVARLPAFFSVRHVIRLRPVDACDVSFEFPGSFSLLG